MTKKDDLIEKIVDVEWKMFQKVPNVGGRASCQDDYKTFKINRYGQAMSWSESVLESYLEDLVNAENQGRNLLTEKYAHMMKSTSPEEYSRIVHLIPEMNLEVITIVDEIVNIVLSWEKEIKSKYPDVAKRGRPIYSNEDNRYTTSIETYLRGELLTYSLKTLKLYLENITKQKSENINGSEIALDYMMRQYGFSSIKEANERLKNRS
jgi:hypothetical protein